MLPRACLLSHCHRAASCYIKPPSLLLLPSLWTPLRSIRSETSTQEHKDSSTNNRMPRNFKKGKGRKAGWDRRPKTDYKDVQKDNDRFETYYRVQKIVPDEEWSDFMTALRSPLPTTFRITGTRESAVEVRRQFEDHYFSHLNTVTFSNGESVEPPKPIRWYPERLAWHLQAPRQFIRKSKELKKFHTFLVQQNEQGNISRQEAVSMIPPFLLDVKPHHKVLDMCAAPGSKTAQLIEMIHAEGNSMPEGLVVANDADNKRCYMLVHQTKRLQSPCFMITNHDASIFPSLYTTAADGTKQRLYFDRVLADVPCSGDGTLRKNVTIWRSWNPMNAIGLHPLQSRILERGLQLLAVDGLIVYSTCSLNPIENEAVVAHMLRKHKGSVELVDVSSQLPRLRRSPGLKTWTIMDRSQNVYASPEDCKDNSKIHTTMFPPSKDELEWMRLERCCRLLPHHQDTGGFFVAVLRKTAPLSQRESKDIAQSAEAASTTTTTANASAADAGDADGDETVIRPSDPVQRSGQRLFNEDPYVFLVDEPEKKNILDGILDFYGFGPNFPKELMLTRSHGGKKRNVYIVSPLIKSIVANNIDDGLRVTNTGVRVFTRSDSKQEGLVFRMCQEGIDVTMPFMQKRVVHATAEDVLAILHEDTPFIDTLSSATEKAFNELSEGACAIVVEKGSPSVEKTEDGRGFRPLPCTVRMVGWRGRKTIRCLVGKHERLHYKLLVGAPPVLAEADGKKRYDNKGSSSSSSSSSSAKRAAEPEQQQQETGGDDGEEQPRKRARAGDDEGPSVWTTIKSWFGF
ncbi:hypothetical protein PTSG_02162 [Salpingoeca rosetta]|uniref:SAM-dependent MTase RsmB/NOP-type domain-containing protein n=1 Tax=Salpingoeca rosetta (strain ATCC 50818 / BSB-021) TaxID=946362 RepID=F2U1D9_SALR5|nr:uncharacterized protein PTSG_02162 [Salpingoeca rosetta]EGD81441.1 hypothetical protein PTSG_02162 [Salpingoeca rosetta]|eukprot:XP_004996645.1 hypothetical protein PTSG_02162 [Salpingoeca rosetta]